MKRQILALTSLRLFAAVFIVVDHATGQLEGWVREIPFYQGVTFFFVLSGFILTYSYPVVKGWDDAKAFWVARFARIWPAYIASFVLTAVLVPGVLGGLASPMGALKGVLAALCLQAWIPFPEYYFAVNAVAWSISAEAFFYACFPWLIRDLDRYWAVRLAFCAAVVVAITLIVGMLNLPTYTSTGHELDAGGLIYTFPLTRLLEFMIGMAAASLFLHHRWARIERPGTATILEVAIVAAVIAQFALSPAWYEWYSPLRHVLNNGAVLWIERSGSAPLYALLIGVFAQEKGAISRALRGELWVLGGEISFSLYLVHQVWLRWMLSHGAVVDRMPPFLIWVLYTVVIFATSYAMWALIEKPCKKRITGWYRGRARAALIPVVVLPEDRLS